MHPVRTGGLTCMLNEFMREVGANYIGWILGPITLAVGSRVVRRWRRHRPPRAGRPADDQ